MKQKSGIKETWSFLKIYLFTYLFIYLKFYSLDFWDDGSL